MRNIFIGLLLCSLLFSCASPEPQEIGRDGLVQVNFVAPQVYGHVPTRTQTKAVGDIDEVLDNLPITDLEEGATLWLTYELKTGDATYDPPVLKPYVVRRSGGGYTALYACGYTVDGDKVMVTEEDAAETTSPLYLKHDAVYRFRMISPAMPIYEDDLSMMVDNGDSFCSSDQRYLETSSLDTQIQATTSGVNYVKLNPMIQQTARLKFTLKKGSNVSSIRMMGDGVEISGIQNPYLHSSVGEVYNWSSMNLADTLVMRLGDKRAWLTLPGDRFSTDGEGNLVGEICILPTDARSNTVAILLNMAVNGVPTQYFTTLNRMVFEHAKSYNMTFSVSLKNDIVVVNWQNVSWTEDI